MSSFIDKLKQEALDLGVAPPVLNIKESGSTLDLSEQNLKDTYTPLVWKSLKSDSNFRILNLDKNKISEASLQGLFTLMSENGSSIESLSLRFNKINDRAGQELKRLKRVTYETFKRNWHIDLEGNNVSQSLIQELKEQLDDEPSDTIVLRDKQIKYVPESLRNTDCKVLDLSKNMLEFITNMPFRLIKAVLAHNSITKIQGFEFCEHLEILDLSFNKIEKIEGLPRSLCELNLANNYIEMIENLEMCLSLNKLNLENNMLSSKRSVQALKVNSNIITLVLAGNQFAYQPHYKDFVVETLPHVVNLDHQVLSSSSLKQTQHFSEDFSNIRFSKTRRRPDIPDSKVYFKQIYWFCEMSNNEIDDHIASSDFYNYAADEAVLYSGDYTSKIVLVVRGAVSYMGSLFESGAHLFPNALNTPVLLEGDLVAVIPTSLFMIDGIRNLPSQYEESVNQEDLQNKVKKTIDDLFSDVDLGPESKREASFIEEEALEYLNSSSKKKHVALDRKNFRKFVEQPPSEIEVERKTEQFLVDDADTLEIKKVREELKEEISTYVITLKSLLNTSINVFTPRKTMTIKDVIDLCDLNSRHEDPYKYLHAKCPNRLNDPDIRPIVDEIIELSKLANQYKQYLVEAIYQIDAKNEVGLRETKNMLIEEGLLPMNY